MRASIDDVARSALASLDTDAGFLRAVGWASDRFHELATKLRLRSLRRIAQITLPATISDGTVTVNRGDFVVTGDATAQAAWSDDLIGRSIRVRTVWYDIAGVVRSGGTTSLQLATEFTENDASATTYKVIQRRARLSGEAKHLGKFVHMRFRREIEQVPLTQLDVLEPDRLITNAAGPWYAVEVGADPADGVRVMEFHPYPTQAETIHYVYWQDPPVMRPGDLLPNGIDVYALREGVLVDLMRYEMSRALAAGAIEKAAVWRNDYRTQVTQWEKTLTDVQRADHGQDDVTLILRSPAFPDERRWFRNDSARTEIWIRGDRP
jgi:hypothetical protein